MWGYLSWEIFGKKQETGFKIWIFHDFPAMYRFLNLDFFRGFLGFLGDPKISWNADFLQCLRILKDGLVQKFFAVFPQWTGFKIWIFCSFPRFFGDPKKSQNTDFFAISWDFEGRACPKFFGTQTSQQFSWDFEGTDSPKKISELANLYAVFSGFWRDGPTQKIESLDSEPGNREVWKALTNRFSSWPSHPLKISAF
jgi:hypothetical protein